MEKKFKRAALIGLFLFFIFLSVFLFKIFISTASERMESGLETESREERKEEIVSHFAPCPGC